MLLTKKNVLRASTFLVALGFLLLGLLYVFNGGETSTCQYEWNLNCTTMDIILDLFIFVPIVILCLAVYLLQDEVFKSWKRFTIIYLFIYLFIETISPWRANDYSPFEKGSDALFLTAIYIVISLLLITWKYFRTRAH